MFAGTKRPVNTTVSPVAMDVEAFSNVASEGEFITSKKIQ